MMPLGHRNGEHMNIDELVEELLEIRKQFGNLEVKTNNTIEEYDAPVDSVSVGMYENDDHEYVFLNFE